MAALEPVNQGVTFSNYLPPNHNTHNFIVDLGLKCVDCGSYNTVRDKGPLVRQPPETKDPVEQSMSMQLTPPMSPMANAVIDVPSSSSQPPSFTMTPEPSPMSLR